MNRRTVSKLWLCTSGIVLSGMTLPAIATPTIYTDAHNDQVGSSNAARDIWSASIDDDGTDLYITINDNPAANLATSAFNYGIGLTTGVAGAGGDTSANAATHGNAYIRTISIDPSLGGMMDWLGLFGAGGSGTTGSPFTGYAFNDYTFGTPGSTKPAGVWTNINTVGSGVPFNKQTNAFSPPGGTTNSSITFAVPVADFASNLPLTPGSTFKFDIYSTGTSAGQTAYDSLADQSPTNNGGQVAAANTPQYNGTVLDSYTMNVTPAPLSLVWNNATGAGDGATWDMAQPGGTTAGGTINQNWLDSTTPFFFFANNAVTFNDSNNNNYNVTLNTTVKPAAVLVNNSAGNYVISGTGVISGAATLTKMGSSTLTLSTANTYTGLTTVSGGTLIAASNSALGSSTAATAGLSIGAAAVDFTSAAPAIASLTSTVAGASVVLGNSANSTATVLTVGGNNASTIFGGSISDLSVTNSAAVGSLIKVGTGTLTLTAVNTYTGTTTINAGTLKLDANQGGSISTTLPLILGGGTFTLLGKTGAATSDTIGGLTLNSGSGSGFAVDGGNSTSTSLNVVGPITATTAGTSLNISTATSGSTTGIVTTTQANVNGILSGRITLNGSDFAANGVTPGTSPIGAPTYTAISTSGGTNSNNSLVNNSAALGAGITTTNSLKITDTSAGQSLTIDGGKTLALTSGGLLFTGASDYSITGGTLESASPGPSDLIVHQYGAGTLTIGSSIADGNGSSTLTKAGPGTLVLGGANNYSGTTFVNAGTLVLNGTNTSPTYLVNSATLSLGAGGAINNGAVTISGSGSLIETAANGLSGSSTLQLTSSAATAILSQPNSYAGNTTITAGTLQLANANAVQNSNVNLNVAGGLTFAPSIGTFTLGGLTGSTNLPLVDTATLPVTVQLANTGSTSYSGVLSGGGGVTQIGSGTTTLTAANTYTGMTTVSAGTLVATNNASFGNTTAATAGLLLNPTAGTATVDFTSANPNIASLTSSGAGTANIVLGNAGATPNATTLSVGFNNATTTFSGVISDLSGTNATAAGALTKVGTGALVLTAANTYSGITSGTPPTTVGTTFNGGTLVVENVQALSLPTVPLVVSPSSTVSNTITLDVATDSSIDPYNLTEGNSGTLIIESDKTTPASPGITQTFGNLSYGAATLTIAAGPNVSGGSPAVAFGNVTLNSVHNNTTIFNPTTANLLLNGGVTSNAGTSPSVQIVTLQLDGLTAGNTIAGGISDAAAGGSTAVTKSNSSTWTLSGVSTYTGNTNVNGGTLALTDAGALASPNINVAFGAIANINGLLTGPVPPAPTQPPTLAVNGTLNFGPADAQNNPGGGIFLRTLNSLSIGTGSNPALVTVASPAHATRTLLLTSGLTLNGSTGAWTGSLDLTGSDMMVPNGGSGTLAQIVNQLQQGFKAPGTGGIYSSTAAANPKHNTTLAAILNQDNNGNALYGSGPMGSFDNQSPGNNDVLVKYTYFGDADLNGQVNANDYIQIDAGFASQTTATPLTGWFNGDFNYDGVINGDDYTLIDNAFNTQGGVSLAGVSAGPAEMIAADTAQVSAVPEPSSLGLLAISAAGMLRRRRRKILT
jgi:fibronectin-binding autotransporter adhesin